ncbi:uncharacterized protein K02A2.6-like [Sycon ciliatum]|uniref:uncharacterized protein K02A2.6-like n=1 Tax=Sycon ciliatum TaxID=27933 RepID=UPI0031F5FC79
MEQLLADIPMVVVYLDDILISGTTREEHDLHVKMVLERLESAGLRLNRDKCVFGRSSVTFLGHIIDSTGITPTAEKVQDVLDTKAPTNVSQLRSYLGLINYYHNCDASPYGIGAVLSHITTDGDEHPVVFASRTLSSAEQKYAQIEKEVFGRSFVLQTDHKPLLGLFQEDRPIPPMASGRIQRWALLLASYDQLQFKSGSSNGNADGLSRLPSPSSVPEVPTPAEVVLLMSVLENTPVTSTTIAQWTSKDPVLSLVLKYVQEGWPDNIPVDYQAYSRCRNELSVISGCLLLGSRVIIPPRRRETLLEELHEGRPGITRMKALARSYIWWPSIDDDIELKVKSCQPYQVIQKSPALQPLYPWEWPGKPWVRLHVDYAGPVEGKMLLVIVDSFSKFIEVHPVSSATSASTIAKLRQTFATHGLPLQLVSDNGSVFTSDEFQRFCSANGIKHTRSSPYHPASNGLAERAVQTVKNALRKSVGGSDLESCLYRFLFQYRLTPQSTTGQSPFQLMMGHKPRSRLDLTFPDTYKKVFSRQQAAVDRRPAHSAPFCCGDPVSCVNFAGSPKWMDGVLEECLGPATFTVRLPDGRLWKRHSDHIRPRLPAEEPPVAAPVQATTAYPAVVPSGQPLNHPVSTSSVLDSDASELQPSVDSVPTVVSASPVPPAPEPVTLPESQSAGSTPAIRPRRSTRAVQAPVRLDL